jgi:hypothetical protein
MLFSYNEVLLATRPANKLRRALFGCARLFIQYIRSYLTYLEASQTKR